MVQNQEAQLSLSLSPAILAYEPTFRLTSSLTRNLENIDRERWAFDRLIIDPGYEGWLRRRAYVRSGHHSLHIEGNQLSQERVMRILEAQIDEVPQEREAEEVRSWNRAMHFVDQVSQSAEIPISSLLIRHMHQLMLGPNDRSKRPGEFRLGVALVRHPLTRRVVYAGPPAGDVPDLVHQFEQWLSEHVDKLHAVLIAGIAHLRLVEIHPFVDGNGRTARALTTLVLQRLGYSFNKLLALDRYFDYDLVKYCDAIGDSVGESFREKRDITPWLEYFTFALSVEISLASNEMIDLRRAMENWHARLSAKGYSERHQDSLAYAAINGSIRPRDVARLFHVSSVTAGQDLKRLELMGLLKSEGYGRARRYTPAEGMMDRV